MKRYLLVVFALTVSLSLFSQQPRNIFATAYAGLDKSLIKTGGEWFPYPAYSDRAAWDKLMGPHKKELIKAGEKLLKYEWKVIPASSYLEFERSGSRTIMEKPNTSNFDALGLLVLAELAEGQGRFLDQIINGIWLQTEKTSWVHSAHQGRQKSKRALPDSRDIIIDLGSQKWGQLIAITQHFFREEFDKVDPSISYAVDAALKRNIFDPYMDVTKQGANWWLGLDGKRASLNNWTPWCNANVLLACLLEEKDRDKLLAEVDQSIRSLDVYMDTNKMDGACDEGPSYWFHAAGTLYDYLRIINSATGDRIGLFDDPQVRNMALYESRAFVGDGWTVNFGDGSPSQSLAPEVIYRFGKDCGLKEMTDFAIILDAQKNKGKVGKCSLDKGNIYRALETLRYESMYRKDAKAALEEAGGDVALMQKNLRASVPAFTWYDETQHIMMKNGKGWNFAAKGGNNAESHNHNDVGSFILYIDDIPVLVDAGVETYRRQTFSSERYSIWTMRSEWHNLPSINGEMEHQGREFAARSVKADKSKASFSLDIAGAYVPEAACNSWVRSYSLKDGSLEIADKFSLASRKAADVEHFLVKGSVDISKPGVVLIESSSRDKTRSVKVKLVYPKSLTASVEEMKLTDPKIHKNWGVDSLMRISLTSAGKAPVKGSYVFKIVKD